MSDIDTLKAYYRNLLIVQYHDKPKAKATIDALVDAFIPVNSINGNLLLNDIRDAFDIETAVGVQLDMLGGWIGIDRLYKGQNIDNITAFGFTDEYDTDYDDVVGFTTADDFGSESGSYIGTEDLISITNRLNDDDFRFLLKLKIAQNHSDYSLYGLDTILYDLFGMDLYFNDNLDMSMTYYISPDKMRLLPVMLEKKLLLKPMGVGIHEVLPADYYYGFLDAENLSNMNVPDNSGFSGVDSFADDLGTFLGLEDIIV